jgi:hypothetical protein
MRRFPRYLIAGGLVACLVAVSCSFNEPRIRSEPVILQPSNPTTLQPTGCIPLSDTATCSETTQDGKAAPPDKVLATICQEKTAWYTRGLGQAIGGTSGNECVYEVVTEDSLDRALLSTDQAVRDNAILQVLSLSDRSCDNFRAKVFAFRTSATFAGGFFNSILSGTSAITALVSGPAGSALSAANLATGSALNGINSSYYANKMMDQLDADIETRRSSLRSQILARVPTAQSSDPDGDDNGDASPVPTATTAAKPYTGLDAKLDLQSYDNLCSLETLTRPSPSPTSTASPTVTPTPTATATPVLKVTAPGALTAEYSSANPTSTTGTLAIVNPKTSGLNVAISGIAIAAKDGTTGGFGTTSNCVKTLNSGDPECDETITFTPKNLKSSTATLTVKSNAPGVPATAALEGKVKPVALTASQKTVSLDASHLTQTLTLTNPDTALNIKITGLSTKAPFTATNTGSDSVAHGQSASISISYTPGPKAAKGVLVVTVDSSTAKLTIHLTGAAK